MSRWLNSRGASPLLVIIALALMAGFLYWLNLEASAADDEVVAVMEDEGDDEEISDIVPAQLVNDPSSLTGRPGVLRDVPIQETLGRGVVTIDLDGTTAYPVLFGPDMIARGTQLANTQRVTFWGRVYTLNDSIRSAWVDRDAVDDDMAGSIPETSSFVLADSVTYN